MQPPRTNSRRTTVMSHFYQIRRAQVSVILMMTGLIVSLIPNDLFAQSTAWQSLTAASDVEISFIVHRYGDGQNAGVVIRLINTAHEERVFRFRVIFRSESRERLSEPVTGVLAPLEVRTGESAGLWWIPFKDGSPVTEVGLKGLRIRIPTPENH